MLEKGAYEESIFVKNNILIPMLAYQWWNFCGGLYLPEFGDFASLAHHVVTMGIAYFSISGPVWQYYAVYFLGCSEVSTVPLTIVDIFAKFPRLCERFPTVNSVSRLLFAFLFLVSRVIYFPILDYSFWMDNYELHQSGKVRQYLPIVFFLVANIFMTGLQFFWGSKMLGFVNKTIKGPKPRESKKNH